MQSAFYKIGSHGKLFKCKTLKIQSKLPEDDGKMLDNVSCRSLESLFLQVYSFKSAESDILLNMTHVPGPKIKFILKYMSSSLKSPSD